MNPPTTLLTNGKSEYPLEVQQLSWRERQLAELIYDRGLMTARDIEDAAIVELRNATIRSMLNRLVAKGLLVRHPIGPHSSYFYGPAITKESERSAALQRLADDFFRGSFEDLAQVIGALIDRRAQQSMTALKPPIKAAATGNPHKARAA